jgi:hypothetical protein
VEGVVSAASGEVGVPALVAIQDATGGMLVRLPDEAPRPARGTILRAGGRLADPYGQLEVRPTAAGLAALGTRPVPDPLPVAATALGEGTEGRLVVLEGVLDAPISREPGGDVLLTLVDAGGTTFRARATRAAGIEPAAARPGARLRVTGVVGQRASRKGALDGYRVWLRDATDLAVVAPAPAASPSPAASASATPGGGARVEAIAAALRRSSGTVVVEGVVTTPATLLDGTGRRLIIQDATAAVEVLLPAGTTAPAVGLRLRVTGELGTAYGAPRVRAAAIARLGGGAPPRPRRLTVEPGGRDEGQLVSIDGDVVDVRRTGDRWRAEVHSGSTTFVVAGMAGAGIPATTLAEGRRASVIGVVRRPHPAASDRRFAVVPRGAEDVRPGGPARSAAATGPSSDGPKSAAGGGPVGGTASTDGDVDGDGGVVDVDLAGIADHAGRQVRVGGLVVAVARDALLLDDGTATAELRLRGEAASLAVVLEPGDAVSAVGRVVDARPGEDGAAVEVTDPAGLARLGELGEAVPIERAAVGGASAAAGSGSAAGTGEPGPAVDAPPSPRGGSVPALAAGAALLALGLAAGMLLARRRRARRVAAARIAARLAALAAVPPGLPGPAQTGGGTPTAAALAAGPGVSVREPA